jgi:hypothetical protein
MTYSYAILTISSSAYHEIRKLLEKAGYDDQFIHKDGRVLLNMHGLALERDTSHDDDCIDCGRGPKECECA